MYNFHYQVFAASDALAIATGMTELDEATLVDNGGFVHEPLPHPITHVRILEVLQRLDGEDEIIRCRLKHGRLVDYDQCYAALSYTWSQGTAQRVIQINGQNVRVRANLYEFLYLYRQKLMVRNSPTVFLWIDALCLDFNNVHERNSQVQIMPTIYSRAKVNINWLEPLPDKQELHKGRLGLQKCITFMHGARCDLERTRNYHNDQFLLSKYGAPEKGHQRPPYFDEWQVMLQLCNHRYWSRLWVVIENRFAQNLMVMHGDKLWSWEDFRAPFVLAWVLAQIKLSEPSADPLSVSQKLLQSAAVDTIKTRLDFETSDLVKSLHGEGAPYTRYATEKWQSLSEKASLIDLFMQHQERPCTVDADKIYALIGMSDTDLTIDYERTSIELFSATLLSLKTELDIEFVVNLAKRLKLATFEPKMQIRPSMSRASSVLSRGSHASSPYLSGRTCNKIYAVKTLPMRTEAQDIIQARLGLNKLNYYRIVSAQHLDRMQHWNDFPSKPESAFAAKRPTLAAPVPIVDGFDLSDTKFSAAMFVNPSPKVHRKALLGMVSTDDVRVGDVLATDAGMNVAVVFRVSGLARTWLTVVAITLFVRRVTVSTQLTSQVSPGNSINASRQSSLTDFCEFSQPTPFTIVNRDDSDRFTITPQHMQIEHLLSGVRTSGSLEGRPSSSATPVSFQHQSDEKCTTKNDRLGKFFDVFVHRRRYTK